MISAETLIAMAEKDMSNEEIADLVFEGMKNAVKATIFVTCAVYLRPECYMCAMKDIWVDRFRREFMHGPKEDHLKRLIDEDENPQAVIRLAVLWAKDEAEKMMGDEPCTMDEVPVPDSFKKAAGIAMLRVGPEAWDMGGEL
jgi:hypothetical protein